MSLDDQAKQLAKRIVEIRQTIRTLEREIRDIIQQIAALECEKPDPRGKVSLL
jgi:prefoldin subunit 5